MDFGPHARIELRRALDERRPIVFVGPRRGGLTSWVHSAILALDEDVRLIDLRNAAGRSADSLCAEFSEVLSAGASGEQGLGDLAVVFARFFDRHPGRILLFANCHAASTEIRNALLSAVSDPPPGVLTRGRVVLEGAIDFDAICSDAFPGGLSQHPLVVYSEPPSPWRRVVEVEEVMRRRRPNLPASTIPTLCDVVGADLGLLSDTLEALPGAATRVGPDAIARALERAVRASAAADIRRSLPADGTADAILLRALTSGQVVPGKSPDVLAPSPLKTLYLAGLAFFDHALEAYRIASPLTARIIADAKAWSKVGDAAFIQSRAAYLLSITASVELDLRALVGGQSQDALKGIKARVPTNIFLKRVRKAVVDAGLEQTAARSVLGILADGSHAEQTVLDAALSRSSGSLETGREVEWLELSELLSLAQSVGVLPDDLRPHGDRFVERRNDVAHLRVLSTDEMEELQKDALKFIRGLARPSIGISVANDDSEED